VLVILFLIIWEFIFIFIVLSNNLWKIDNDWDCCRYFGIYRNCM